MDNDRQNREATQKLLDSITSSGVITLPGDDLTHDMLETLNESIGSVKIGHGLTYRKEKVICTLSGRLSHHYPASYQISSCKKRYFPKVNDQVVGIIEDKAGDFYLVNIFCGHSCLLNRLAFEGATKRNKPELKKGDVIYARVILTGADADTELSCISTIGSKKEWSSGETVYGLLPSGLTVRVDSATVRRLLRPDCAVLNALGRALSFEVAVGLNGIIWFRSANESIDLVIIRNAILNSQFLNEDQCDNMVEKLLEMARIKKSQA